MDCRHFLFLEKNLCRASQSVERGLLCIKGRMVSILGNFSLRLSSSRVAEIGNGRKLWPISPMCSTARLSLFQSLKMAAAVYRIFDSRMGKVPTIISFYLESGNTQEAKGNIGTMSSMNMYLYRVTFHSVTRYMYSVHSVYKTPQPASHGCGDKDLPNGHLAGDKRGRSNLGVSEDGQRGREGGRGRQ